MQGFYWGSTSGKGNREGAKEGKEPEKARRAIRLPSEGERERLGASVPDGLAV